MERKTKKIMFGSFCAGAVFALVGFWLFEVWWGSLLGLGAGLVAGYIMYDARKFLVKVPEAFRLTVTWLRNQETWLWRFGAWWKDQSIAFANWYKTYSHPINVTLVLAWPFIVSLFCALWFEPAFVYKESLLVNIIVLTFAGFGYLFIGVCMPLLFVTGLVLGSALKGLEWEKKCSPTFHNSFDLEELKAKGFTEVQTTYLRMFRWMFLGVFVWHLQMLCFLCWRMWPKIGRGIARGTVEFCRAVVVLFVSLGKFFVFLVRLTHCRARVICAFFGTGGGAVGFLFLAPSVETLAQKAVTVVFCGLIGMAVGLLEYKVVALRWLKIVPKGNGG